MNGTLENIFHWPEMPALPPPGQPVLIRAAIAQARPAARQELRNALRQLLAAWSNISPEELPLCETASGPVWPGQLGGQSLDISLSYAGGEGWIGLIRAGWIGLDAMRFQQIPESENMARHYLGPSVLAAIQQSTDPAMAFTVAWTELEARLKCLKQGLNEWSLAGALATAGCANQTTVFSDRLVLSVATAYIRK